jgi:CRISPR-associated protein Csy1
MYFRDWMRALDPARFEVFFYHLRAGRDEITASIAARADHFRAFAGNDARPSRVAPVIRSDALDVLVYPELGMDATSFALAAMRLAPRQYAAWGHPVTSGHSTIDGFFTCAVMEPDDGDAHYTEPLIRLPGIGTRYARPETVPATRAALGLPEAGPLLLCPQSLFKIHPDNDDLFARILAAHPKATLLFFAERAPALGERFMRRLEGTCMRDGVEFRQRARILPRVDHDGYLRINLACDLMLDTLHWSGGNTTLDALACGLPVVTLPGRFMRGRQSAGMLRLIGMPQLVAADPDDYVRIVARLAADAGERAAIREALRDRRAAIFDDPAPLLAFQAFVEAAASRAV